MAGFHTLPSIGNHTFRVDAYGPAIGALLALAPYVVFLLPNEKVIGAGDYTSFQLPVREYARAEILAGRIPLWIPYLTCGTPLHASQQAALSYPPVTLSVLLLSANYGMKLNIFLHVALCYWGQYKLARLLGISRLASSFAGLVTCQSGFVVFHLLEGHVNLVIEYALVPWFFWALIRMLRTPTAISAVALAGVTGLLALGGQPQILFYCLLVGGMWAVGSLVHGAAAEHRGRFLAWSLCAAVLAILLSAVQQLPALELARDGHGVTSRGTIEYAGSFAAKTVDCLTFWWPTYLGSRHAAALEVPMQHGFVHERTNYLGLLTPPLFFFGLATKTARWQWPLVGLIIFCFFIALGPNTPVFGLLGEVIPGLFLFRCPARILLIVGVLGSLLAARGLDSLVQGAPWANQRGLFAVALLALLGLNVIVDSLLYLIGLGTPYFAHVQKHLLLKLTIAGVLTIFTIAILLVLPRLGRRSESAAYYLVLFFTAADLWVTNTRHLRLESPSPARELPDERQGDPNVRLVDAPRFPTIGYLGLHYSGLVPIAIDQQWTSVVTNEGGVLPQAVERLHNALLRNSSPALKAASCNWAWLGGPWKPLPGALPRARFVPNHANDLCSIPLSAITEEQVQQLADCTTSCTIESEGGRKVTIHAQAPTGGIVVFADTFYPGWKCHSNGMELEIIPVHGVFRGVPVPAGTHRLVFSYEPWTFPLGLILSIAGLLILAALIVCDRRRTQTAHPINARRHHGQ